MRPSSLSSPRTFSTPQRIPVSSFHSLPRPLETTGMFSDIMDTLILNISYTWNHTRRDLLCLAMLRPMPTPFLFKAEYYSILCIYHVSHFVYPSIRPWTLGSFHLLAGVNGAPAIVTCKSSLDLFSILCG